MKSIYKKLAIVSVIAAVLIWAGFATGIISNIGWFPGVSHTGKVTFYVQGFCTDDTSNYDGAGTLDVVASASPYQILETLTFATDTATKNVYTSGQTYYFVCKSTTATDMDYFVYSVTFPYADAFSNQLWSLIWVEGNPGTWTLTMKGALENQPTLLGYKATGAVWGAAGTDSYTFSSTVNYWTGTLRIAIGANYGGLFAFFDPEESGGREDSLYLILTQNTSAATHGLQVQGAGWQICVDGKSYAYNVGALIASSGGALVRWDEKGAFGYIEVPIAFYCNGDLDTAGTGDTIVTITLYECLSLTEALNQVVGGDSVDNFSSDPTAEQCEFTDG